MKNYYFKVVLIALFSIIFTCFFDNKSFAGFFLEGEYHNEPIPMSSLINETSWDAMQNYVSDVWGVDFPTWSQASAVDDMLEDLAMFYVGQTVSVSQNVASAVANAVLDSTSTVYDIWDMISFDGDSGEFVRNPNYSDNDLSDVIHGAVYPLIYNEGSSTVGNWVPLPVGIAVAGSSVVAAICENSGSSDIYMCRVGNNYLIASLGNNVQTMKITDKPSNYVHYLSYGPGSSGSAYNGSLYSGWYYPNSGLYPVNPSVTAYSSNSVALADFFGIERHDEPYLNGEGIIVNENPDYKPVTGYSVMNYDYSTHIVNNYNTGEPITWPVGVNTVRPYTYEYNGIYWDSPELETLEYPAELEFPSVEFETISIDENVDSALESLDGSWIVKFFLVAILLLVLGLII